MTKIYFKKSDEILESEINTGQTLLDAAKKINISEIKVDMKKPDNIQGLFYPLIKKLLSLILIQIFINLLNLNTR